MPEDIISINTGGGIARPPLDGTSGPIGATGAGALDIAITATRDESEVGLQPTLIEALTRTGVAQPVNINLGGTRFTGALVPRLLVTSVYPSIVKKDEASFRAGVRNASQWFFVSSDGAVEFGNKAVLAGRAGDRTHLEEYGQLVDALASGESLDPRVFGTAMPTSALEAFELAARHLDRKGVGVVGRKSTDLPDQDAKDGFTRDLKVTLNAAASLAKMRVTTGWLP